MTSNQSENESNNAPRRAEGDARGSRLAGKLPEHLRAPEGVPQDVHEINLLLTAMLMGAQATYFWLNTKRPNVDAARRSSMRLHKQQIKLNALFNAIADQQPDRLDRR
ncbi:hypothetical protein [Rhizobium sp. Root1220]|uniref:hypothetical protein n=1 Tax=Rhizobium sp. Root1220 TaxID=1736432 RepID=UPI0007016119|nr:hypothetical protein [Rhizobium sp. Root1220]KQV70358.1 hypothetical protein ASC90_09620 [Rhizobium sp. Root1220]